MDTDMEDAPNVELKPHQEQEITRLWRTWRTVHEMLVDRGYAITEEERKISRADFYAKFRDRSTGTVDRRLLRLNAAPTDDMIAKLTPRITKKNPTPVTAAGSIWVEFCHETTVGVKHTRQFAHYLTANSYTYGVFITIGPVSQAAIRAWDVLPNEGRTAEHFREEDLLVNITRHELVPTHILLSDEEKKTLLDRYRLKETQLPRMQQTDPVAKYLGLKKGQVVKIIRKSETAGRYASYRWVF